MVAGAAVEAVGADFALGQADGVNQVLQGVELQGIYAEMFAYAVHHLGVALRCGVGIFFEVLFAIFALKLVDNSAGYQFHLALRGCELDECAGIDQRGA